MATKMSLTSSIPGNRRPWTGEVLQVFLFNHKIQREVLLVAAASTAEKIMEKWRRANILTSDVSLVEILKLYKEYGILATQKRETIRNEEMHFQRQPRRRSTSCIPR